MNGNQKGCFAEYHFATTAIKKGFNVSVPLLDSSMYDCILEKDGKLFKVQVKYLGADRYKHGRSIQIVLKRSGSPSYPAHLVDYFALWSEEFNGFFIIKNEGQKSLRLSIYNQYKENFNNFALIS